GDGHFQKKCVDKIRDFQQRGKTILFCSHALYFVSTLCQRTLWLDQGRVRAFGPTVDVVHEYEEFLLRQERDREEQEAAVPEPERTSPVRIRDVAIRNGRGEAATIFRTGDDLEIHLEIDADDPQQPIHVLAGIDRAADGMQCFALATTFDGLEPLAGHQAYKVVLRIEKIPLVRGDYSLALFVGDEHGVHVFDRRDFSTAFSIAGDRYDIGLVKVDHTWELMPREEREPAIAAGKWSPAGP
ncbi:MAG TPA: Wzt carbohydrate-binding domain-containing protein, partial [Thermoanaerobaculia bacterium]|nr:Wzt carbohydrate-binding domain-containing protein [Thermoanaerobaculia bacterium]